MTGHRPFSELRKGTMTDNEYAFDVLKRAGRLLKRATETYGVRRVILDNEQVYGVRVTIEAKEREDD